MLNFSFFNNFQIYFHSKRSLLASELVEKGSYRTKKWLQSLIIVVRGSIDCYNNSWIAIAMGHHMGETLFHMNNKIVKYVSPSYISYKSDDRISIQVLLINLPICYLNPNNTIIEKIMIIFNQKLC